MWSIMLGVKDLNIVFELSPYDCHNMQERQEKDYSDDDSDEGNEGTNGGL